VGIPEGVYDLTIFNGDCQEDTLEDAFVIAPPLRFIYLPVTHK
jgi:hypothetical protein